MDVLWDNVPACLTAATQLVWLDVPECMPKAPTCTLTDTHMRTRCVEAAL